MALKVSVPKLKRWDWIALAVVVVSLALAGANWFASMERGIDGLTPGFAFAQLILCLGSLMVLGKTAKEGTLWGNLAAVAGMLAGMSGVLLAAALWVAA